MGLHDSQSISGPELPEASHLLLKFLCKLGKLLRCLVLEPICVELESFLTPVEIEPIHLAFLHKFLVLLNLVEKNRSLLLAKATLGHALLSILPVRLSINCDREIADSLVDLHVISNV